MRNLKNPPARQYVHLLKCIKNYQKVMAAQPIAFNTPRYHNVATFFRAMQFNGLFEKDLSDEEQQRKTIGFIGMPFDGGCTYRPGARFAPAAIREASRLMKSYHIYHKVDMFAECHVVDCGDVLCPPFNTTQSMLSAVPQIEHFLNHIDMPLFVGGDHTISYPILKAISAKHGQVMLIHFDAHFDTWDSFFGEGVTHGTPFRRAMDDGCLVKNSCVHIGTRGTVDSDSTLVEDSVLGFHTFTMDDVEEQGVAAISRKVKSIVKDHPVYISIDIDVLDVAHAPGTGTPSACGFTTSQLVGNLRCLKGVNMVGGDLVEVSPPYDTQGQQTAIAASTILYEMAILMFHGCRGSI